MYAKMKENEKIIFKQLPLQSGKTLYPFVELPWVFKVSHEDTSPFAPQGIESSSSKDISLLHMLNSAISPGIVWLSLKPPTITIKHVSIAFFPIIKR